MVSPFCVNFFELVCAGYLARTKTAAANVNVAGLSVNDSLYSHYIGLPGSVRASVRVGNLNSKSYSFVADIAFCHENAPP